jgi:hypothetical protein
MMDGQFDVAVETATYKDFSAAGREALNGWTN